MVITKSGTAAEGLSHGIEPGRQIGRDERADGFSCSARKHCRQCGSTNIPAARIRNRNYLCVECHRVREKARYRASLGRPPRKHVRYPTKVVATILDAVTEHGCTTTMELSEATGLLRHTCSARVADLVSAGVLRRIGLMLDGRPGGVPIQFELAPIKKAWDGTTCGNCPTPPRCRMWGKCLGGTQVLRSTKGLTP